MNNKVYTKEEIINAIKPVAEKYNLSKVELFGSYSRGDATFDSDIDLIVSGESISTLYDKYLIHGEISRALDKKVDLLLEKSLAEQKEKNEHVKSFLQIIEEDREVIYG